MTATLSFLPFLPLPLPAPLPMVSYRGVGLSGRRLDGVRLSLWGPGCRWRAVGCASACGSSLLGAGLPSLASCPPTRTLYGSGAPAAGMGAPAAREALN